MIWILGCILYNAHTMANTEAGNFNFSLGNLHSVLRDKYNLLLWTPHLPTAEAYTETVSVLIDSKNDNQLCSQIRTNTYLQNKREKNKFISHR